MCRLRQFWIPMFLLCMIIYPLFIHLWEKNVPLGFSSVKRCFHCIIKRLWSQTDKNLKKKKRVRSHHWQSRHGIFWCTDRIDRRKIIIAWFISLCQLAVVHQPLCFVASVVKTPLKQSEVFCVNGRMNGPLWCNHLPPTEKSALLTVWFGNWGLKPNITYFLHTSTLWLWHMQFVLYDQDWLHKLVLITAFMACCTCMKLYGN